MVLQEELLAAIGQRAVENRQCPICGGSKTDGAITFTADLQETLVVIRGIPATVCTLCGNEWLADATAAMLEQIVDDARKKSCLVEVAQFSALVQSMAISRLHAA